MVLYEVMKFCNLGDQSQFESSNLKYVHFGHVHSQLVTSVNTRVHGKVLSLSYHAIVIF